MIARTPALLTLLVLVLGATTTEGQVTDETIFRRIEWLRERTNRLTLDGKDTDWRDVPKMVDDRGDTEGDPARDIVAASIAPIEDELWILLQTSIPPSEQPWSFYVRVDLVGENGYDFRIDLKTFSEPLLTRPPEPGQPAFEPTTIEGVRVAARRAIEIRIPYRAIAPLWPAAMRDQISGEKARPWVRIQCGTWDGLLERIIDEGPTVASYRLVDTPYPLDSPLPQRPKPPSGIRLPVAGQWFIAQGPFGAFSHRRNWAYDLIKIDHLGHQLAPLGSRRLEDFHAWDAPVLAPFDGRVTMSRFKLPDSPVMGGKTPNAMANEVCLESDAGLVLRLRHFQRDSISVRRGDQVTTGQAIGAVGNSGNSSAPHLHFARRSATLYGRSLPLSLTNVRVGLNPVAKDPWARDLDSWEPRYGYFVEERAPKTPTP